MDRKTVNALIGGAVGGLAGGVLFGIILQATIGIAGVGRLIGAEGVGMGWFTLLVITTVLGLVYAVTFGRAPHSWGTGALYGLVHGALWWVLGVLIVMPLMLGEALFAMTEANWINLVGYLAYGLVLGLVYTAMAQERPVPVRGQ